jgi:hypothetical protein
MSMPRQKAGSHHKMRRSSAFTQMLRSPVGRASAREREVLSPLEKSEIGIKRLRAAVVAVRDVKE